MMAVIVGSGLFAASIGFMLWFLAALWREGRAARMWLVKPRASRSITGRSQEPVPAENTRWRKCA